MFKEFFFHNLISTTMKFPIKTRIFSMIIRNTFNTFNDSVIGQYADFLYAKYPILVFYNENYRWMVWPSSRRNIKEKRNLRHSVCVKNFQFWVPSVVYLPMLCSKTSIVLVTYEFCEISVPLISCRVRNIEFSQGGHP